MKHEGDFTDTSRLKKQLKYELNSNIKLQNGLLQSNQQKDADNLNE